MEWKKLFGLKWYNFDKSIPTIIIFKGAMFLLDVSTIELYIMTLTTFCTPHPIIHTIKEITFKKQTGILGRNNIQQEMSQSCDECPKGISLA